MILGEVSVAHISITANVLSPNLCQMKVQEKISNYVLHFYVRSLLHGVICVKNVNVRQTVDSWATLAVNDLFTVSKQLAIRFQRNFACILMGSVRIAVQTFIDLVFDLDLSRSQMCKITFWAIPRFLLDKSSPNGVAWVGDFQQIKKYLERCVRRTRTRYVGRHYAK